MLGTQCHLSKNDSLYLRVTPVRNEPDSYKNQVGTGLWTSSWNESNQSSGWIEFCRQRFPSGLDKANIFLLTPKPDAKICVVSSLKDLDLLYQKYPASNPQPFGLRLLDYERIAQDYDAIHLTTSGCLQTRFSFPLSLSGWDCESTLWFRWVFLDSIQKISVEELLIQ